MSVEKTLNQIAIPRLQIECLHDNYKYYDQTWIYELVYEHFTGEIVKVKMGETKIKSSIGEQQPIDEDGKLILPVRDGAHIKHDAIKLNLPAFAICDDIVQKIELEDFKSKFPDKY